MQHDERNGGLKGQVVNFYIMAKIFGGRDAPVCSAEKGKTREKI